MDFSADTFQKIVHAYPTPNASTPNDDEDLSVTRYLAFTASAAGDCEGVMLNFYLSKNADDAETITATLQENSGGWSDVATVNKSRTYLDLRGSNNNTCQCVWRYFEFGATHAINTNADTWRIKLETNAAVNEGNINQNGTTYLFAVVLADATTYSASDSVYMADDITLTIDQDVTVANMVFGAYSTFDWENPPAASYTLSMAKLYPSYMSTFQVGTSASPIPAAERAIIDWDATGTCTHYASYEVKKVKMYGAEPENVHSFLAADAASGQKDIVLEDDFSADWSVGDTIYIMGRDHTTGYDSEVITAISGTTVTTTNNLAAIHYKGFCVYNYTKKDDCGIRIDDSYTGATYGWTTVELVGLEIDSSQGWTWDTRALGHTTYITPTIVRNIIMGNNGEVNFYQYSTAGRLSASGSSFKNIYGTSVYNAGIIISNYTDSTVQDVYMGKSGGSVGISVASSYNMTIIDIQTSGALASYYYPMALSLTNSTVLRLRTIRAGNTGCIYFQGTGVTFTDCIFDGSGGVSAIYATANATGIVFDNCEFDQCVGGTYTFDNRDGMAVEYLSTDGSAFTVNETDLATAVVGSYIKGHNFDDTAYDHRSWWKYGKMISTKAGLADTTVHTAGGQAIRFEPLDEDDNLDWAIDVPTGNIQDKEMMVGVWVKLNNATYYAGTHEMPRITVNYDDGTTGYGEAAETTDWQYIFIAFTPITTYPQITVTLSGATDATTTDAYIYWDDMSVLLPAGVTLNLGNMDLWASALPVVPPIATALTAADVWATATSTLTGSGTIGKLLTKVLTVAKFLGLK